MGLFKKKAQEPFLVGDAVCGISGEGHGFVGQRHHEAITSEAIGAFAPVTFALSIAIGFASRSNQDAQRWMERIIEFGDPGTLSAEVNYSGVVPMAGAADRPLKAVMMGNFGLLPSNQLMGTWTPRGPVDPDIDALPLLGALLAGAAWLNQDREVWYALDVAAAAEIDFTDATLLADLPQQLLDAGAEFVAMQNMKFRS